MILSGCVLYLASAGINLLGVSHWHFLLALFALGVGWNFMFISATQLVSQTYAPQERAKAQACNEFLVFSMVVASSLSAGFLEATVGWQTLNLWSMPVVVIALLATIVLSRGSVTPARLPAG
jgi:MFS family permease